jgi:hypothetical protein
MLCPIAAPRVPIPSIKPLRLGTKNVSLESSF